METIQQAASQFEQAGFAPAGQEAPRRLVLSIVGEEKTGKTHLALTGRPPVVLFNLDVGMEGVVEKFTQAGKQVYHYDIPVERVRSDDVAGQQDVWKQQWYDFVQRFQGVYDLAPGTVIVDTWTEVYELARLAHFGKTEQVMPQHYAAVNAELRSLVRHAYNSTETTTAFISKMGTNFNSGQPEVKGFRDTAYLVQLTLQNSHQNADGGVGAGVFQSQVISCRQNPATQGFALLDEKFDLSYLEWLTHDWRPET